MSRYDKDTWTNRYCDKPKLPAWHHTPAREGIKNLLRKGLDVLPADEANERIVDLEADLIILQAKYDELLAFCGPTATRTRGRPSHETIPNSD